MNDFIVFRKFNTIEEASLLGEKLKESNIDFLMSEDTLKFDAAFAFNPLNKQFEIKIKQVDFERARQLLEKEAESTIENISKDHYLYDFSDEELMEIVEKSDEWNEVDFILAKKILAQHGKEIPSSRIEEYREKRLDEMRKPEKVNIGWIIAGFFFAITGFAYPWIFPLIIGVFFEVLGMTIAISILFFYKVDSQGKRFYAFDANSRKAARIMLIIGVLSILTDIYLIFNWQLFF